MGVVILPHVSTLRGGKRIIPRTYDQTRWEYLCDTSIDINYW